MKCPKCGCPTQLHQPCKNCAKKGLKNTCRVHDCRPKKSLKRSLKRSLKSSKKASFKKEEKPERKSLRLLKLTQNICGCITKTTGQPCQRRVALGEKTCPVHHDHCEYIPEVEKKVKKVERVKEEAKEEIKEEKRIDVKAQVRSIEAKVKEEAWLQQEAFTESQLKEVAEKRLTSEDLRKQKAELEKGKTSKKMAQGIAKEKKMEETTVIEEQREEKIELEKEIEKSEREQLERLERERLETAKLEKEKREKERVEAAKLEEEKGAKLQRERLEEEKREKERVEKEAEKLEEEKRAKLQRERLEEEKREKERVENERLQREKERIEAEKGKQRAEEEEELAPRLRQYIINEKPVSLPIFEENITLTSDDSRKYQLERHLGHGKSGEVWRARDKSTNNYVVIKAPKDPSENESRKSIENEAVKLAQMEGFCGTYIMCSGDSFGIGPVTYLVLEDLSDYHLLSAIVEKQDALPSPSQLAILVSNLMNGLEELHEHKMAHRDIKPKNILYHPTEFHIKFIDFGNACFQDLKCQDCNCNDQLTTTTRFTPGEFCAPELQKLYKKGEQKEWNEDTIWNGPTMDLEIWQEADVWQLGLTILCVLQQEYDYSLWKKHQTVVDISNFKYSTFGRDENALIDHYITNRKFPLGAKKLNNETLLYQSDQKILGLQKEINVYMEERKLSLESMLEKNPQKRSMPDKVFISSRKPAGPLDLDSTIDVMLADLKAKTQYLIVSVIAMGGDSVVYRAIDTETKEDVSIKCADVGTENVDYLEKELSVLKYLKCGKFVPCYIGHFKLNNRLFIVTKYLEDFVRLDRLVSTFSSDVKDKTGVIYQLLRGLHHLQKTGVCHRDIRPENIFVNQFSPNPDNKLKFTDFGSSCFEKGAEVCSNCGCQEMRVRKPDEFIAPEIRKLWESEKVEDVDFEKTRYLFRWYMHYVSTDRKF
jgi:serine/threonine protein kinase